MPESDAALRIGAAPANFGKKLLLPTRLNVWGFLLLILTVCFWFPTDGRAQDLNRIFEDESKVAGKRPIIVIPGILGSELVNEKNEEVSWPSFSISKEDGLTLPISPRLRENRDSLVARKVLRTAKPAFLVPEIKVYQDLLGALDKYAGYHEGNWDNPAPGDYQDTYYVFPYDWRRDNVESAQLLIKNITTLKAKLNKPNLRFNIMAHSMGGLLARYAAYYGDADIPDTGKLPPITWAGAAHINKIFMFGTPNQGSAATLRILIKGYFSDDRISKIVDSFTSKMDRADAMTIPSIYQLLPHNSSVSFLDENLQPLDIDLFDFNVWRKYGWNIGTDEKFRENFITGKVGGDSAPFAGASLEDLDAFMVAVLQRAKRFHEALDAPFAGEAKVQLYVYGGDCENTLSSPVIYFDNKNQKWITLTRPEGLTTTAGRKISAKDVARAMFAPGDGRVTRRSLLGQDLAGRRRSQLVATTLPIAYALFTCSGHADLPNDKVLLNNALTALLNER